MRKLLPVMFLWFFVCFYSANAQPGKFYSSDKELSNSLINQVYQDSRGFVWIATEDGLNKFDGNKFTIYKQQPGKSDGLLSSYVKSVFEDSNNRFWVICVNGVQLYDRSTDMFHNMPIQLKEGKIAPHMSAIIERKNKEVWLSTYGQGVVALKDNKLVPKDGLNNMTNSYYIHTIYEDKENNIWIASQDKGLFCYSPEKNTLQKFNEHKDLTSEDISMLLEDKNGDLFAGTLNGGLMKFHRQDGRFEPIPYKGKTDLNIKTLMTDKENNLFIGTEGFGMKQYDRDKNCITDCNINIGVFDLTSAKVHSIIEDKDGNLWLGIFQKGLLFIPSMQNKFNYYGYKSYKKSSIGSSCVMSIYRDKDGVTWVATDNDGLYGIDDDGHQLVHFKEERNNHSAPANIMCLLEDSSKRLWAGSYFNGLARIEKKTGTAHYVNHLFGERDKGIKEKVFCLMEDEEKNVWIGTYGSGIYKMSPGQEILAQYRSDKTENDDWSIDQLCNDWINCMMQDDEGLLWIGTNNGLSCLDLHKGTFINFFSKNNLLPNLFIHALLQDSNGAIWIGTSEGLYRFDKHKRDFAVYNTENGLPGNVICGIIEDKDGNFWISTHQGIAKLLFQSKVFINYYAPDGLQGNEFTRGAFFKDQKGKIYFGGTSGITTFYPDEITLQKKIMKVQITDFMLANHSVKKGDKSGNDVITDTLVMDSKHFTLAYDHNSFTLEFSTMEFSNPEKIIYQYKMEGLNADWMSTNAGMNRVAYNRLTPGKYRFMVQAKDNENVSDVHAVFILITPPWYQTWWASIIWALLACLVMLSITMYLLSRLRNKQKLMELAHQEEISEAKLQFFINISHEIRTPMTLIISPLEKLLAEGNTDKHSTYLMIYRNAQRILRLINQLMDIRKLDKKQMHLRFCETDIVGFIDDLMQTFDYQAQKKKITFSFIHEDKELKAWVDLNNFDKVLLNVFSNAFKYTPEDGEITVTLITGTDEYVRGPLRRYFEITVSDTGIGIDKDKVEQVFERFYQINNGSMASNFGTGIGLHLSRSLVELHHGTITAGNQEEGEGSRFTIRLPLGNSHLKPEDLENPQEMAENIPASATPQKLEVKEVPGNNLAAAEPDNIRKSRVKTHYRVLVIEDDDEIRHYLRNELSGNYRIKECVNGKEALDTILKEKPDLIISDIMMPEMDGITLCRKVKQNINVNHIPVILLTAKSQAEDRIEGLKTGADAYIVKPFNSELVQTTVSNLIANRERLKNKFSGEKQVDGQITKIERKSNDEILMGKIIKTINEHIADPALNVEMLAANAGMSRIHMHRKLKELTNQSARDFIRNIRLKQAMILLEEKKYTVSEIAHATGFSNISHFSNCFKEFYGMSPTTYKGGIKQD